MSLANVSFVGAMPAIGSIALFSDFDGTLVEMEAIPGNVVVPAQTRSLLSDLKKKTGGAFAIISGRRIDDLDRMLAPLTLSASGCHGAEIRLQPIGETQALAQPMPPDIRQRLRDFTRRMPGVQFEDKVYGICLHFHDVPEAHENLEREWPAISAGFENHLHGHFNKRGCEIKRHNLDKGDAIRRFLAAPVFRDKMPVYLGDDVLDREAFAAIRTAGGIAISVSEDNVFPEASFALPSVPAVHQWLTALITG